MKDNSAAIAARFSTSLKALRLYERLGMLVPPRTKAGWRVYGPAETERLHAILSLKQLGLPLARIAEMLRSGKTDLNTLLSVQEEMLLRARMETDRALTLIRIAKTRLQKEEKLSADDFATMVRKISATVLRWTPELDELAKRFYTPEQMQNIRRREIDPTEAARLSAAWEKIMSDLDGLNEPSSAEALDVGRRMVALFRESAQGDKTLWNNSARFWQEAVTAPSVSEQGKMDTVRYQFVGRVLAELQNRGELNSRFRLRPPQGQTVPW